MSNYICPHETPGGPQRCPLCRRAVEAQHEGYDDHHREPDWKVMQRIAARNAVPMPDHVRAAWDELRQGRKPAAREQGELL